MPRVHLVGPRVRGPDTACGRRFHDLQPLRISSDPADVTCRACQKTLAMAEAEIRQGQRAVPRRRR